MEVGDPVGGEEGEEIEGMVEEEEDIEGMVEGVVEGDLLARVNHPQRTEIKETTRAEVEVNHLIGAVIKQAIGTNLNLLTRNIHLVGIEEVLIKEKTGTMIGRTLGINHHLARVNHLDGIKEKALKKVVGMRSNQTRGTHPNLLARSSHLVGMELVLIKQKMETMIGQALGADLARDHHPVGIKELVLIMKRKETQVGHPGTDQNLLGVDIYLAGDSHLVGMAIALGEDVDVGVKVGGTEEEGMLMVEVLVAAVELTVGSKEKLLARGSGQARIKELLQTKKHGGPLTKQVVGGIRKLVGMK